MTVKEGTGENGETAGRRGGIQEVDGGKSGGAEGGRKGEERSSWLDKREIAIVEDRGERWRQASESMQREVSGEQGYQHRVCDRGRDLGMHCINYIGKIFVIIN